jgi:TolB-like protein
MCQKQLFVGGEAMSVLQTLVPSPQGPPSPAGRANSALGVAHFGAFEVNFLDRELRRNGMRVKLQEKPFQILEALLEKAGGLVRREELREKLWRSDTFVGFDRSINTAVTVLRKTLDDSVDNPRFIETRTGLGYRFVAPVRMGNVAAPRTGPTVNTIAVLPFASPDSDTEMELLSDSITESVVAHLARLAGVRVIASSCVFRYRGPGADPLAVGHDFNSRAVLTGWITRRHDSVTISTELVNVAGGWRLWGEQYNLNLPDAFEVQAEISKDICDQLRRRLTEADTDRQTLICDTAARGPSEKGLMRSIRVGSKELMAPQVAKKSVSGRPLVSILPLTHSG